MSQYIQTVHYMSQYMQTVHYVSQYMQTVHYMSQYMQTVHYMFQYIQTVHIGFQNVELELLYVYSYRRCDVRYVTSFWILAFLIKYVFVKVAFISRI
jgi:hypothetical protein